MTLDQKKIDEIQRKYAALESSFNEKSRRLWAATEAMSYGWGGTTLVCAALGMSPSTVNKGIKEIKNPSKILNNRTRDVGGGRKKITKSQRGLRKALLDLLDPNTKGDPERRLKWTSKSTKNLANALKMKGYSVTPVTVGSLLHDLNYSLQLNKKSLTGSSHADRDAQFNYINQSIIEFQTNNQPTISIDTKKKENLGNFKNNGKEYCPKGKPVKVLDHDFPDKRLGKVIPYGVYDIGKNTGWVSVGISSDTAEFAVNTIKTWWLKMGTEYYPKAESLLITADCGGSNGYRVKLWKFKLQELANELGLKIHVRHFPPGTSKWNKVEHRLFSYISQNWRGQPLLSREMVVQLIANTKTSRGLKVRAVLDENIYETGKEITNEQMASLNVLGDKFHEEWNYTIIPQKNKNP